MNTTIEALQGLYVAMGGTLSNVQNIVTIPDMINAIATLAASRAGGGLPTVTTDDNGEVLTVVSGSWAAADAPTELPAVTATDNGKVLKVVDGAWAVAADATE